MPLPIELTHKEYEKELLRLQTELVFMQEWIVAEGRRLVVLFEGRDTAGKGGAISRITAYLNPRTCRIAALPTPSEREQSEWYFQRYAAHLPAAGEMVLFDRSWYNRAGVERVMGFCTKSRVRGVPALLSAVRAVAAERRHHAREVLAVGQRRGAGATLQEASDRPAQALEVQPDRPPVAGALGGLRRSQGPHVRAHRHRVQPMARGRGATTSARRG